MMPLSASLQGTFWPARGIATPSLIVIVTVNRIFASMSFNRLRWIGVVSGEAVESDADGERMPRWAIVWYRHYYAMSHQGYIETSANGEKL